jgi:hypothetical protein
MAFESYMEASVRSLAKVVSGVLAVSYSLLVPVIFAILTWELLRCPLS